MERTTNDNINVLEASDTAHSASRSKVELQSQSHPLLPEEPVVVIEPSKSWAAVNLRDLWAYRELLYFLMWRDIKVRYKQTVLGVAWVVMQPLLTTLIFTVFLSKLARVPSSKGIPYPLFAYAGLLLWTLFSSAVTTGGNSLVSSANLITKVYFPRVLIPSAAIGARLIDFVIGFVILAGLMLYYGIVPTFNILLMPFIVLLLTLLTLGIGMWTSAMNVKYRDIGVALPVLVQLWMFVSPIIYPVDIVPGEWLWLYSLNPLVGIVENFRIALFGGHFNWPALTVSMLVTLALIVYSAFVFRRMEKSFADLV